MSRSFVFKTTSPKNLVKYPIDAKCAVDLPNGIRLNANIRIEESPEEFYQNNDKIGHSKIIQSQVLDDGSIVYLLLSNQPSNDKNVIHNEYLPNNSYLIFKYQQ